jgi:hypothetical protein
VLGIIVYWAFGFAFAYGKVVINTTDPPSYSSANQFIGHNHFFLLNDNLFHHQDSIVGYPPRVVHYGSFHGEFFFNFVFAATATTITSGIEYFFLILRKVITNKQFCWRKSKFLPQAPLIYNAYVKYVFIHNYFFLLIFIYI